MADPSSSQIQGHARTRARESTPRLDWFAWNQAEYVPRQPDAKGVLKSQTFPGLWLNVTALLSHRFDAVLDTVELGIRSAAHAEFVTQLARLRRQPRRR